MSYFIARLFALAVLLVSASALAKPVLGFSGKHGASFSVADYRSATSPDKPLTISLTLSADDAARLHELSKANLGERITIRIGRHELSTPTVRVPLEGLTFDWSVPDDASFRDLKAALGAKR